MPLCCYWISFPLSQEPHSGDIARCHSPRSHKFGSGKGFYGIFSNSKEMWGMQTYSGCEKAMCFPSVNAKCKAQSQDGYSSGNLYFVSWVLEHFSVSEYSLFKEGVLFLHSPWGPTVWSLHLLRITDFACRIDSDLSNYLIEKKPNSLSAILYRKSAWNVQVSLDFYSFAFSLRSWP